MNSINILDLPDEVLKEILKYVENDKNLRLTCFKFWELICDLNRENESLRIDARLLTYNTLDLDRAFETSKIELIFNYVKESEIGNISKFEDKIESFLRSHGQRVTHFGSNICLQNYFTKFIPLLPNLETVSLFKKIPTSEIQKIAKFSVNVKELIVHDAISEDCLEMFDIEVLDLRYFKNGLEKCLNVLQKWNNLKQLKFYLSNFVVDFTKALERIQLDKLELTYISNIDHKMLGNLLKSQNFLKEFRCFKISKKNWTIICDNLKQLEILKIDFIEDITAEKFKKISNLTKLKSLTIINENFDDMLSEVQNDFTQSCFKELTSTQLLQNLEYLEFQIHFKLTTQHIVNLAANYPKLKSLNLVSFKEQTFDVFVTIFKQFNQLNCLEIFVNLQEDTEKTHLKEFLSQNFENSHLKKLHLNTNGMDLEKIIRKFADSFPNLEIIDFYDIESYELNHLQMILTEFKNLKAISEFTFGVENINILKEFGQKLERFKINLSGIEDPDAICEGCGITYITSDHTTTICLNRGEKKDEMKWSDGAFFQYCEWKKLRTMMDSKKEINKMQINLINASKFQITNLIKHLEIIGRNVKTLTLHDVENIFYIKIFLDAFPNCEILQIRLTTFYENLEKKYLIESSKVKVISLGFFINYDYEMHSIRMLDEFLKKTNFSALKRLTLRISSHLMIKKALKRQTVLESHQKCLKYQPKLKKVSDKVDDKGSIILEFSDE